jgi:hypothetical protein
MEHIGMMYIYRLGLDFSCVRLEWKTIIFPIGTVYVTITNWRIYVKQYMRKHANLFIFIMTKIKPWERMRKNKF